MYNPGCSGNNRLRPESELIEKTKNPVPETCMVTEYSLVRSVGTWTNTTLLIPCMNKDYLIHQFAEDIIVKYKSKEKLQASYDLQVDLS